MNKVILMGRLTRDPEMRYTSGENQLAIARYTLAVDRRFSRRNQGQDNGQTADFINCVAFGKSAEFAGNYLHQGTKIAVTGRIQTGSYTNKEGRKVYTTEVVIEDQEFAESKKSAEASGDVNYGSSASSSGSAGMDKPDPSGAADGFMNIPDAIEENLPFN